MKIFLYFFFCFLPLVSFANDNLQNLKNTFESEMIKADVEIDSYLKKITAEQRLTDSYYWYLIGRREAIFEFYFLIYY